MQESGLGTRKALENDVPECRQIFLRILDLLEPISSLFYFSLPSVGATFPEQAKNLVGARQMVAYFSILVTKANTGPLAKFQLSVSRLMPKIGASHVSKAETTARWLVSEIFDGLLNE